MLTETEIAAMKISRSRTRAYRTWAAMKQRCSDPQHSAFKWYGARGIAVCERWQDYDNFLADMGQPPNKLSLGRINNDGNYEPSNCRWETQFDQAQNMRSTKLLTFNGKTASMSEWGRITGLGVATISKRIIAGWPIKEVLTRLSRKGLSMKEMAELLKDKERLDWLEKRSSELSWNDEEPGERAVFEIIGRNDREWRLRGEGETLRKAIDAAIAKEKK